jgi:hypothetical protein
VRYAQLLERPSSIGANANVGCMTTAYTPTRQRAIASPAAYSLAQAGVTQRDLATALDVSQQVVAHYLRGTRRQPSGLREALESLVGEEATQQVLAAIPAYDPEPARLAMRAWRQAKRIEEFRAAGSAA